MDQKLRRVHPPVFKAKVALEAIKETRTIAQLASIYSIHPTQIAKWKKKALEGIAQLFSEGWHEQQRSDDALIQELFAQIGKLKVEKDFLKKKIGLIEDDVFNRHP